MANVLDNDSVEFFLLQQYFLPAGVLAIRNILTSPRKQKDFLCWQPDPRGQFSVGSAYKLAMEAHEVVF